MAVSPRSDLAQEVHKLCGGEQLPGVRVSEEGAVFRLSVEDAEGSAALGLPQGNYVNLSILPLLRREDDAFPRLCEQIAHELRELLPGEGCILVAALGNPAMTPDALGSLCADKLLITRHLGGLLPGFRPLCSLRCGVLGTTGMESAALVKSAVELSECAAVIAVDALCAADEEKLCATVQLSDAGIVPGSGVGNSRMALTRESLGVPVLSLGVPTVMDAGTIGGKPGMFVTTRDIDLRVKLSAKLLAYGINMAVQDMSVEDVDMMVE